MDKFTIRGTKKLLGLTRTKIRLAKEAKTKHTKPAPLPLIKLLSGREIGTVEQAEEYCETLKSNIDHDDPKKVAKTILELMDIIEGVKYKFETQDFMPNLDGGQMENIEKTASETSKPLNLLLMTGKAPENPVELNLFVGYDPPEGTTFLSRVPTSFAPVMYYCFNSNYFSKNGKLKNINIILGHQTLILNAVYFALGEFGMNLIDEMKK